MDFLKEATKFLSDTNCVWDQPSLRRIIAGLAQMIVTERERDIWGTQALNESSEHTALKARLAAAEDGLPPEPPYYMDSDVVSRAEYNEFRESAVAQIAALTQEVEKSRAALTEVVGCFDAAYVEGLAERLAEQDFEDGNLRGLVERRLLPAAAVAKGGAE